MGTNALRKCKECGLEAWVVEDLDAFVKSPDSLHGRRNSCRKCAGAKTDNADKKMRDWKTDYQVKKRYGIDRETYIKRMATSSVCQCCGSLENLCYDHCHDTMEFRGVLCRSCNKAIGQLGDDMEGITRAYNYLRDHYEKH